MAKQSFKTLVNSKGDERTPESPTENVSLRFNGYWEKPDAASKTVDVDKAAEDAKAGKPTQDTPAPKK